MAGTAARWALTSGDRAVWTTLAVNLVGSFLLGLVLEVLLRREDDIVGHVGWRLLLGTGFCGAFTTYSAMALDTASLLEQGRQGVGVILMTATVLGGLVAAGLGVLVGVLTHRIVPGGSR